MHLYLKIENFLNSVQFALQIGSSVDVGDSGNSATTAVDVAVDDDGGASGRSVFEQWAIRFGDGDAVAAKGGRRRLRIVLGDGAMAFGHGGTVFGGGSEQGGFGAGAAMEDGHLGRVVLRPIARRRVGRADPISDIRPQAHALAVRLFEAGELLEERRAVVARAGAEDVELRRVVRDLEQVGDRPEYLVVGALLDRLVDEEQVDGGGNVANEEHDDDAGE